MESARDLADSMAAQSPVFSHYTRGNMAYYEGVNDEALRWLLKSFGSDSIGGITGIPLGRTLGQLDLLPEALRLDEGSHYWTYLNLRMWPELIALARERFERDVTDENSRLFLANALHLSGDVAQAQVLYEEFLRQRPGLPIIDRTSETVAPTARAALGRLRSGDTEGAQALIELTREDLRQRRLAGFVHEEFYRAAAILAVLEADNDAALENIEKAIETGPRDPSLFSEPAFEVLRDSEQFQALESRLDSILAAQRVRALQMICFNNPVPDAWQPLPDTCAGVGQL
jgi:tetratricopeptide (TPR) repeat protein